MLTPEDLWSLKGGDTLYFTQGGVMLEATLLREGNDLTGYVVLPHAMLLSDKANDLVNWSTTPERAIMEQPE